VYTFFADPLATSVLTTAFGVRQNSWYANFSQVTGVAASNGQCAA